MNRSALVLATAALSCLILAGCASPVESGASTRSSSPSPTPIATNVVAVPQDAAAFTQLAEVAPKSLKLEGGTVTSTACWTPSEHLFNDLSVATAGTWKVLCRVYYDLKGEGRYQDSTCIGDFDATPMLDHCYVWELYSGEAHFEDGASLASPAPTPIP